MAQNIFTEELAEGVVQALKQRVQTNLMNDPEKINQFILYKNGKMPWVKLQSSVNHYGDVADGTSIAQRWVLRSLFTNKEASFIEYQERNQLEAYNYTGDFGYRPLPGIESATVTTLQPLGSLRQAVINYKCWTKGQLENLERLYMRPGFSCLLEWGWSYYLDDNNELKSITDGVNYFDTSQSEQQIIDKITKIKKDTNYHYDGMIGFVKNFSWKLRPDGGYDCSTTLISKGELITSMTVNVSSYALDTKTSPMSKFSFKNGASGKNFGMFTFKALTNSSGYEGKDDDDILENASGSVSEDGNASKESYATMLNYQYAKSILSGIFYELAAFSDIDDQRPGIDYQKFSAYNSDFPETNPIPVVSMKLKNDYGVEISRKEGSVGNFAFGSSDEKKFIYLKDFIRLVNNYAIFHYKGTKKKDSVPMFRINTGNIRSKYHPLVISSNYDVCFVKPSTLVIDKIKTLSSGSYVDPEVSAKIDSFSNYLNKNFGPGQDYKLFDYGIDDSYANASHVLLNLHYLYSKINDALLQSESDSDKNGSINLSSFMTSILSEVSSKLGGICDLKMTFDDTRGVCKIIDTNLLVEISKAKKAELDEFPIPIFGERSIVKNVGVESRIFAEQATMISIAAQVGGGTQYGFDSTVMGIYNDGLTDRFFTAKDHKINLKSPNKDKELKEQQKEEEFQNMTEAGAKYVDYFLNNLPGASSDGETSGVVLDDSYLKNLLRFVESRNQSNQVAKNSRILPLNLGLTFDGISGFLIGNILNLENNVVPEPFASSVHSFNDKKNIEGENGKEKLYKKYIRDVDYYFAITGIDHSINIGGWLTNIKTNYVLYNKDDKRTKSGTQFSPKVQIDKVFQGDILVMGFGATTLEAELSNNLSAGKKLPPNEALTNSMAQARALYFAELMRDLNNTGTNGRKFSKWDIISIIGNSFQESGMSPVIEQKPFIYKGVWSGAGYGLIQFDVNQLRMPLMGNNGKGTNWGRKSDLKLDEIEAHEIWNWDITKDGYLGLRPLIDLSVSSKSVDSFIEHFKNYKVVDRINMVETKYNVPINFRQIVTTSNTVYNKYRTRIGEMGFDENAFKMFTYQVEYIYTLFATPGNSYFNIPLAYTPSGDNNRDFKDSYKKITRKIVGGGKEAMSDRMKKCDQIRDFISNHPELNFGTL